MYGIVDAGLVYQSSQTSLGSTSAQSEAIDRWFSDDVEFAKLHRQSAGTMILVGMQDAVLVRHISLVLRRAIPHSELVEVADEGPRNDVPVSCATGAKDQRVLKRLRVFA
jgi:pimeloyl-ACP methyl ester carboxylesterase